MVFGQDRSLKMDYGLKKIQVISRALKICFYGMISFIFIPKKASIPTKVI